MTLDVYRTIALKRDGHALEPWVWRNVVRGFLAGEVADYQMSALLMAVAIRGLEDRELEALTEAMIESGARLDLSRLAPIADKHSTGGVGDKTTLVVAPLAAASGVRVAKMSGRGLGHTGGTIDKLESIPGFRTDLDHDSFIRQVEEVGVAVIGQRPDLVPADKALYALRDVTATVDSAPLIAASIVSKKVAAGAMAVVFDVKTGSGAFMRERAAAEALGRTLVGLAARFGVLAQAVLTDMGQPLGRTVGNALEVVEAIETLAGKGAPDLVELCVAVAARMVALGADVSHEDARGRVLGALRTGAGLEVFARWVEAQGGDARVADDTALLPRASVIDVAKAGRGGYVTRLDALAVGRAAASLGAGRMKRDAPIDHAVGVVCLKKVGDKVGLGEPVFEIHTQDEGSAAGARRVLEDDALVIGDKPPTGRLASVLLADPLE